MNKKRKRHRCEVNGCKITNKQVKLYLQNKTLSIIASQKTNIWLQNKFFRNIWLQKCRNENANSSFGK